MAKAPTTEHGTRAGYMQCRKHPEGACEACRVAHNAYMRQYRKNNPKVYKDLKEAQNRRKRAMRVLANRYGDELEQIIRDLKEEDQAKSGQ